MTVPERTARLAVAVRILLALWVAVWPPTASAKPLDLSLTELSLDPENPERMRVGPLLWRGGYSLSASRPDFGGISGLTVSPDGEVLSMVTDSGSWIRMRPRYDEGGNLAGIADASMGALRGTDGTRLRNKKDRDSEEIARIPGGFAVSFEQRHRIWLYEASPHPFAAAPRQISLPGILYRGHPNQGVEALTRLDDGRLIAIAEGFPLGTGDLLGWIRADDRPDTPWQSFRYRRSLLFRPTGAATMPNGDMLLIERRFTWLGGYGARLAVVPAADLRPGATIEAKQIAEFDRPLLVDNFEGVDVRRDARGRTLIYIVSDDNFFFMQRTILAMFELVE